MAERRGAVLVGVSDVSGNADDALMGPAYARDVASEHARAAGGLLAQSHGWLVQARDGAIGRVEMPLYPDGERVPDYLAVSVEVNGRWLAIVPVARIARIDVDRELLLLDVARDAVRRYPRRFPVG